MPRVFRVADRAYARRYGKRMIDPGVAFVSCPDVTPETEAQRLAAVYEYVLRCREARESGEARGDDVMVDGHERRERERSTRR